LSIAALGVFALAAWGCASNKFMPARYSPDMEGHVRIAGAKTVVLAAPYDFITPEERLTYDRRFNPSFYLEDMLQSELRASGVQFVPAKFDCGASFEDLARTLLRGADVPDNCVILASALVWFPDVSAVACDVKVFSPKGELLFEKRGLCTTLWNYWNPRGAPSVPFDASLANDNPAREKDYEAYIRAERSVMRQIFADPDFQKALK
jgi:hypothetical protein